MKEIIFIGKNSEEEYYISLKDNKLTGWSFMGLRPETEDTLRERQRDTEPEDVGIELPDCARQWFDFDAFRDYMEEEWLEHHDSQGEYEKDGETYYLGFGSGTDIFNFFLEHTIQTYKDLKNVLDKELNITEKQFKELLKIMAIYKKEEEKGYSLFMKWQEGVSEFPEGCKNE